jgi:hypothetical protein
MSLNHGSSRIAGVTVSGTLTGPNPFHVWGEGSLSLLFFDVSVPFDATFGLGILAAVLQPADPWPLLSAAIGVLDNWAGDVARWGISLTSTVAGQLLDPGGAATLRQKVLPLSRALELFGEYEISGPDSFAVFGVTLGDDPAHVDPVSDFFVPGDFEKLSASDQLSRDSFELMHSGVRVDNGVRAPVDATKPASLAYQTKIIDSSWRVRTLPVRHLGLDTLIAAAESGAVGRAPSGRSRFARRDGRKAGVVIDAEEYTVATTDTLTGRPDIATGMTKGAARSALRRSGTSSLQVLPRFETELSG